MEWGSREFLAITAEGLLERRLASIAPEFVVSAAWLHTGVAGYEFQSSNATWGRLMVTLCRSVRAVGGHYVGVGTCLEKYSEAEATPYVAAKRYAYLHCNEIMPSESFTWLRLFWIFSQLEKRPRLLADAAQSSHPFTPRRPFAVHDFVEVRDVGTAFVSALRGNLTGVQEIGSGRVRTVADLLACSQYPTTAGPVGDQGSSNHTGEAADVSRLVNLGWRPTFTERYFGVREES